jgi:flagellin
MRINHNLMAMNANRYLSATGSRQSKSLEKISSGLRINTAADDAAGLAISEKMRAQISGLEQASDNALDGISLIQTAEGALQETHSILQRMRELAVQSSNDTNTQSERDEIQKEVDELAKEITRIANNTEFNSKKISNGGLTDNNIGEVKFHIGANTGQDISLSLGAMDAKTLGVSRDVLVGKVANGATDIVGATIDRTTGSAVVDGATLNLTSNGTSQKTQWADTATKISGTTLESKTNSSKYNDYKINVIEAGADGAKSTASIDEEAKTITLTVGGATAGQDTAANISKAFEIAGIDIVASGDATGTVTTSDVAATQTGLGDDEVELTLTDGTDSSTVIVKKDATSVSFTDKLEGVNLELDGAITGGASGAEATIFVKLDSASAATFAAGELDQGAHTAAGVDVLSQSAASSAVTTIEDAIIKVSAERSKLGAYQNRLEHTINNLNTTTENLQASESRIRDVDIASEMMNYTKLNILQQAAQSMLAQANQAPQGVLQLLR